MKAAYPRRPSKPFVIVLDVDGTTMLMPDDRYIPYNDGVSLLKYQVANQRLVNRALSLQDAGFALRFISGRSEALRDVTVRQLEAAGFQGVSARLSLQDKWNGWHALRMHKRDHLFALRAVLHVGDQESDLQASVEAGTPFMHVEEFQRGDTLDGAFCWHCGCTALRACPGPCGWAGPRTCTTCARGDNAPLEAWKVTA